MTTATLTTPSAARATSRRSGALHPLWRVVRLHFADRTTMLWTPPIILAGVAAVCVVIFLLLNWFTPATAAELSEGFRYNQAAIWSWPGFAVTIGVYAYARTMPYAIGMMGSTRRHYWAGTALWVVLQAVYLATLMGLFLLVEQATGHWFTGARMFDVYALGNGSLLDTLVIGFGIGLASVAVGAALAAIYLRWGQLGALVGGAGALLVLLAVLGLILASGTDVVTFFSTDTFLRITAVLVVLAAVATAVSWLVMRRVPLGR